MRPDAFDNRFYFLIPVSRVEEVNFDEVLESRLTLRYNLDSTKTFLCYESVSVPPSLIAIESKEGPYRNEEFLNILNSSDWAIETENLTSEEDPFLG